MHLKGSDKMKDMEMEKKIFPILVVGNSNLKPYIEVFEHRPENIIQQPLGILTGVFEIREYSEDSAYIVNFLNSVIKKEYYLNNKRPVTESFDAALHKVNLALSEIATHGNVNWLGKIDSAICVIEKNSIHFTVTGKAKILLWRKDMLTDITDGLAPENPDPHPLKTFINVSSGRIEKNDKLIITSGDIFDILSTTDIQKSISRFDNDRFSQFLKTAMANELDLAGTIIVDIGEPSKSSPVKKYPSIKASSDAVNVFSGQSFAKKDSEGKNITKKDSLLKQDLEKKTEYVDRKTGHIYIQGDEGENEKETKFLGEKAEIIKEVLYNSMHSIKALAGKQLIAIWKKIKKTISGSIKPLSQKNTGPEKERASIAADTELVNEKKPSFSMKDRFYSVLFMAKISLKKLRVKLSLFIESKLKNETAEKKFGLLPSPLKITALFSSFSKVQKISVFAMIIAMMIFPVFFSKLKKESPPQSSISDIGQPEISENEKLSKEKNIKFVEQVEKIASAEDPVGIFIFNQEKYAVSANKVILYTDENLKDFSWPFDLGKAKLATYMDDLGLIFIITDNKKVLSFSPVSKDFKENMIRFDENFGTDSVSTYLTYLYVLDRNDGKIIRYPRAEGGFGEGTDWLKDEIDFSEEASMAIDENVYIANKDNLVKLFRGARVDFQAEQSETPISFDFVFTNSNNQNIYILDKENARIIKFDKNGSITNQYHHESIAETTSFSIEEPLKKAYFTTASGDIYSLDME